jgi:hypothetical protein
VEQGEVRNFLLLWLGDECELLMAGKCTVQGGWVSRLLDKMSTTENHAFNTLWQERRLIV